MRHIKTFESLNEHKFKIDDHVKYLGVIPELFGLLYKVFETDSDTYGEANSSPTGKKNYYYFIIPVNHKGKTMWVSEDDIILATKEEIESNKYNL